MPKKMVNFGISEETYARAQELAKQKGFTVGTLLQEVVESSIERYALMSSLGQKGSRAESSVGQEDNVRNLPKPRVKTQAKFGGGNKRPESE